MAETSPSHLPADPLIGATLDGRFEIEALIDRGGMGKIYKAVQKPLGRPIALKTLDLLDPTGEYQQRFFNEAAIASKLTHPHTVRIFDYGRAENGVYYLTMELLKGTSMHRVMKKEGPLDPLRVIRIARQVCGALHEAHMAGIVHRDMKPGNIFLTKHDDEDFAKVLDFGLVKNLEATEQLSHTGQTLGSPLYMSPEQVEGENLDHRSDIYSVGLVLYVALCGKVPFKRGNVATVMFQQVSARIPTFAEITPDLTIPSGLEWVVRRCIEKDPDERFATMRDLSLALKLAAQEIRGEIAPLTWELEDGRLVLPDDLGEPQVTEVEVVPPPLDLGRIPEREEASLASRGSLEPLSTTSSTLSGASESSLERSNVSLLVGGAAATAGGLGLGMVVMLGIVVMVAGAGALYYVSRTPNPTPPVVQPVPTPAPVDKAEPVVVTLTSDPEGAEVLKNGSLLGTTPLELRLGTPDALEPMKLTLQADGYDAREVVVDGTVPAVTIPLKKLRVRPAAPTPTPVPETPVPVAPAPTENDDGVRDPWAQ